jgi:type I restriction enzyme S subunit
VKNRWPLRRLAEVADLSSPRVTVDPHSAYPFVAMADIDQETGLGCTYRTVPGRELKSKNKFLSGDILFARITPCVQNGKIALAPDIDTPVGFATTEVFRIGPREGIDRKYLLYFLRSPRVRSAAEASMTGTTNRRRVPREFLEGLWVPVPPLDEQRRIAAKLVAASAVLDEVTRLAEQRKQAIIAVRRALLDWTFGRGSEPGR